VCLRYQRHGGTPCQSMSTRGIDEAVAELFLSAVSPAKIEIALQALEELNLNIRKHSDSGPSVAARGIRRGIGASRYEAADRRTAWWRPNWRCFGSRHCISANDCNKTNSLERREGQTVNEEDCRMIRELSQDLGRVWGARTTSMEERKTLLRLLVKRVHLDGVSEAGKIRIDVEWHTVPTARSKWIVCPWVSGRRRPRGGGPAQSVNFYQTTTMRRSPRRSTKRDWRVPRDCGLTKEW